MGKEKEMLKTILANTELIMEHLKIGKPSKSVASSPAKAPAKKTSAKPAAKKTVGKR